MNFRFAVVAAWMALTPILSCAEEPVKTLPLPRSPRAGEMVFLEVKLGALDRGSRVEIETESGRSLGAVSPFGVRSGKDASTYTIPVPPDAVVADRLKIRIMINDGRKKRSPTAEEIRSVVLKIEPRPQIPQ